MIHSLKLYEEYFKDVELNIKPFDVRKKDRYFEVNDKIIFKEFNKDRQEETGNKTTKIITYVLDDENYCKKDYVILGLKDCKLNIVKSFEEDREMTI